MTESDKPAKPIRPPRFNGPAVLVFGMVIMVFGLSIDGLLWFVGIGIAIVAVGVYGVWALRRYEKAEGIEEKLPGGGRYDAYGNVKEKDDSSGS